MGSEDHDELACLFACLPGLPGLPGSNTAQLTWHLEPSQEHAQSTVCRRMHEDQDQARPRDFETLRLGLIFTDLRHGLGWSLLPGCLPSMPNSAEAGFMGFDRSMGQWPFFSLPTCSNINAHAHAHQARLDSTSFLLVSSIVASQRSVRGHRVMRKGHGSSAVVWMCGCTITMI